MTTWAAGLAIAVISVLHYTTHGDLGSVDSHTLFRRLYYLPIAVLAVTHGLRGGLLSSGVVVVVYVPHAFLADALHGIGLHVHADPAPTLEKVSEMILYVALGSLVGVVVDQVKSRDIELEQARDELERSARLSALGQLVAGVAHEVKNPLASLHATAEMFLDDYDPEHKKRRMAELNFEEVKRLEGIVDRFLAFAKPGPPDRQEADLTQLLDKVRDLTASTASSKGVEVRVEVRVEGPEQVHVVVDADQMVQVLLNLVLNAIDVSPEGAAVVLRGRCEHGETVIDVEDRGPGVPAAIRDRIFDPFFTTRAEGTGLGLSVASQLVVGHGGSIEHQPLEEGGSRFRVRLPRRAPGPGPVRP